MDIPSSVPPKPIGSRTDPVWKVPTIAVEYGGKPAKRSQILAMQRVLFAMAMRKKASTADVTACVKAFDLLEDRLSKLRNGKPAEPSQETPKRTAGLKSKLLSSAVQPTADSGQDEVQKQAGIPESQATDDTTEASEPQ